HLHRLAHEGRRSAGSFHAVHPLTVIRGTTMRHLAALLACLVIAGCATTEGNGRDPRDPWEGYNRGAFAFNDAFDKAIFKPVAKGYEKVVPAPGREGV